MSRKHVRDSISCSRDDYQLDTPIERLIRLTYDWGSSEEKG
jgi:hypothetical protein